MITNAASSLATGTETETVGTDVRPIVDAHRTKALEPRPWGPPAGENLPVGHGRLRGLWMAS